MSELSIIKTSRPRLYGRDKLLSEVKGNLLKRNNYRILLVGSSGIGKSEFARELDASIKRTNEEFISLYYEIKSSAHTVQDLLASLTIQLLEQVEIPNGNNTKGFRSALNQLGMEHTWSLATAALLDVVSTFAPNLKKTADSLILVLQGTSKLLSPQMSAERISKAGNDDLLAGFIRLIEILDINGIHGCLILDRIEGGSQSAQDAAASLINNLPNSWGVVFTVNNETPEGLKTIERLQPQISYVGGKKQLIEPIDIQALEIWRRDVKGFADDINEITRVHENCSGRPLYLKDWVQGLITEEETRLILNDRLGDYYDQRIKSLTKEAKWLLVRLAILPDNSSYSFEFCHQLMLLKLSKSSVDQTWEIISELINQNFLEPDHTSGEQFRVVHAVTRKHIFLTLPQSVIKTAAIDILSIIKVSGSQVQNSSDVYRQLVLSDLAEDRKLVLELALPTAQKLSYLGSYRSALNAYTIALTSADSSESTTISIQATIGIAAVLLNTGYYQDALNRLKAIVTEDLTLELKTEIALLRGEILMRLNRYSQALEEMDKAYEGCSKLEDIKGQITVKKITNTILRDLEDYNEALSQARTLVEQAENELSPSPLLASCFQALSRSLAFFSQTEEGISAAQKSLDISIEAQSIRTEGNSYLAFGEVYRHSHMLDIAIPNYEKAIKIAETISNRDSFLWSSLGLADVLTMKEHYLEALDVLQGVGEIVRHAALHYPLEYFHWQLSIATINYIQNNINESEFKEAAEQYESLNISWPLDYTQKVIDNGRATIAKKM